MLEFGVYFIKTESVTFTLSYVIQYRRGSYPDSMSTPTTFPDSMSAPVRSPAFIVCY